MTDDPERLRRWRLLLGGGDADGTAAALDERSLGLDRCLAQLYDAPPGKTRGGGLGNSSPTVARWLGDIRSYFPASVVRVMQQDALERLNLRRMLLEPELLAAVEPDVHLVGTLLSLGSVLPAETRDTARQVVRRVVDDIERRLAGPMRAAVLGALDRSVRNRRPTYREIDWPRTIRANLRHYQHAYRTIVPETRIGFGRRRNALRDIILCVDQSGSMASSVVYSGVFGAVLASLPAVRTRVVVFDTSVVDLTDQLDDPVELLFGTQLGGGTDIARALSYAQSLIERPEQTILVLISDLIEGGVRENLLSRAGAITAGGTNLISLLALSDDGAPAYDHANAAALAALGAPAFACTPDQFPGLIAAAITRRPLAEWAAAEDVVLTAAEAP